MSPCVCVFQCQPHLPREGAAGGGWGTRVSYLPYLPSYLPYLPSYLPYLPSYLP